MSDAATRPTDRTISSVTKSHARGVARRKEDEGGERVKALFTASV